MFVCFFFLVVSIINYFRFSAQAAALLHRIIGTLLYLVAFPSFCNSDLSSVLDV